MQIYFINLASRPERRAFMEGQFERLGLKAERIEAVTPDDLTDLHRSLYCNPNRRWSMTESRFCCNLSHLKAWDALIGSGKGRALVLEDDAILSDSLPRFLDALSAAGSLPSVIRIEKSWQRSRYYGPVEAWVLPDVGLRKCVSHDVGSAGYIMTLDAAKWLRLEPSFNRQLVDGFLFAPFSRVGRRLNVLQTDPALCMQLGGADRKIGASSINGPEDAAHKAARKKNPYIKFSRHLEIWITQDLPRGVLGLIARIRHSARLIEIQFR